MSNKLLLNNCHLKGFYDLAGLGTVLGYVSDTLILDEYGIMYNKP